MGVRWARVTLSGQILQRMPLYLFLYLILTTCFTQKEMMAARALLARRGRPAPPGCLSSSSVTGRVCQVVFYVALSAGLFEQLLMLEAHLETSVFLNHLLFTHSEHHFPGVFLLFKLKKQSSKETLYIESWKWHLEVWGLPRAWVKT